MKKGIFKKTLCVIITMLILTSSFSMTAFADTTKGTQVNGSTVYYTEDGVRTAVKTVTIDGVDYYDCSGGEPANIDTNYLHNLISTSQDYQDTSNNHTTMNILSLWAEIASAIFANGGKYTCSHNYKDYYGHNHANDSDEQCSIEKLLSNATAQNSGERKKDNYSSTGLSVAGSFSTLRQKMCDEIAYHIGRSTCDGSDILGQGNNCPDALPALDDSTPRDIIYNMATSITREGSTAKYQYNSYCVAFYDFDLMILADEDLEYVTGAEGFRDRENPIKDAADAGVDGFEYNINSSQTNIDSCVNESVLNISDDVTLSNSQSQSVMTSIQNSESYSFSQMIGGEVSFKLFGLESKANTQFTFNQAYESVHTNEATKTIDLSSSYATQTYVPAQTVAYIMQEQGSSSITVPYDTPVALTFKVAIFSMSGDVYADSGLTLAFSTAGYEQSNFSTFFGGSSAETGTYAYDSLNQKVSNTSITGWDSTYGNNHFFYKKHDGSSDPTDTSTIDLDWNAINNYFIEDDIASFDLKFYATTVPMLSAGTSMNVTGESKTSKVYDPLPLYLPTKLRVVDNEKKNMIMFKNGRYYLNTITIGCFNKNDVSYYPFKATDGHWEVCEGSEDIIKFEESTFSVIAKNTGVGYLRWVLNSDVEYTAEYETGTVTSKDLAPVQVAFTVLDNPLSDKFNVAVPDEFKGTVGDAPVNMNELLYVVDSNDNKVNYPIRWEATCSDHNDECFTLTDDNMVTFNDTDTIKVRAIVNPESVSETHTDWIEVTPREEREVIRASINEIKGDDITLIFKYLKTHTKLQNVKYDIASYITFYDQYGDEWLGETPDIDVIVDNQKGADIDDGVLTLSDKGVFNVCIKSPGLAQPVIGNLSFNVDVDVQHEIGDVDSDNYRTIMDVTTIQRYLAQHISEDELNLENSDLDADGKTTIMDATYIQRYLAELITE